jgi:hypothetical protein
MPFDYSRLRSILNNTKLQQDNNALYQVISQIIDGLIELSVSKPVSTSVINLYEIDTSSPVASISLDQYVRNFTIIKDVSGNASGNNINLIGTIDGVINPSLATDYEVIRIFRNSKTGEYHQW